MSDINLVITEDTVEFIHVAEQGLAGPPGPAAQGLTVDQTAAINGANAPSGANPMATMDDIPAAPDLTGLVHSNRTALDNVSGVNTGDQDLSGKADKQSGVILGQRDIPPSTPVVNGQTTVITYANGNSVILDCTALPAGGSFGISITDDLAPTEVGIMTVIVRIGANIPTPAAFSSVTWPTFAANKKYWLTLQTDNGGTTWYGGLVAGPY